MYMERFRLDGKTALVTGAARGIGLAISHALSEAGARVVMADLDPATLEDAKQQLNDAGYHPETIELDVTRSSEVNEAANELTERGITIDILVNNAGISISNSPAETMTDDVWQKVMNVNINGLFYCCRTFGAAMLERRNGVIVNLGSMSGIIVNRPQEQCQYNASKAAVHQLTKSLAAEWATRGVRVNAVAPTYVETALTSFVYDDDEMYGHWVGNTPMNAWDSRMKLRPLFCFSPAMLPA